MNEVLGTKPNDNGYDLMVNGDISIVAEIKCNKPINNGYKYVSQQKEGIKKDIRGLLEGKSKVRSIDLTQAFKFLAIHDFGDHTLPAAQHLIKNLPHDLKDKVTIYEEDQPLTMDKVIFIFIK
ncbi:hypothetical protein AB4Z29_25285 [Paenibacillus sp. 2TAB23]|uniref:hypothetical protein n=1 Tax=Paenibacillus sp. 2TAB23 TaxID=3233004 RepID=UPI003F9DEAE4